jgi:hypothetical protein
MSGYPRSSRSQRPLSLIGEQNWKDKLLELQLFDRLTEEETRYAYSSRRPKTL